MDIDKIVDLVRTATHVGAMTWRRRSEGGFVGRLEGFDGGYRLTLPTVEYGDSYVMLMAPGYQDRVTPIISQRVDMLYSFVKDELFKEGAPYIAPLEDAIFRRLMSRYQNDQS